MLEKKKEDDLACGEIETAHPGYLGSQATLYIDTLKGVGSVYQQTFQAAKHLAIKKYHDNVNRIPDNFNQADNVVVG